MYETMNIIDDILIHKKLFAIFMMLALILILPMVNQDSNRMVVRSPYYEVQLKKALGEERPKINVTSINSGDFSLIGEDVFE
jgi:hypothetical protein